MKQQRNKFPFPSPAGKAVTVFPSGEIKFSFVIVFCFSDLRVHPATGCFAAMPEQGERTSLRLLSANTLIRNIKTKTIITLNYETTSGPGEGYAICAMS